MSSYNRIDLSGDGVYEEAIGSGTVKPGHLVELTSGSAVKVHATEGGYAEIAFATEDQHQGGTVDDSYATTERVSYVIPRRGRRIQAILKAGESVNPSTNLVSAADGTLIAEASVSSGTTVKQIIGKPMETLDNSSSTAVDAFIEIRVL